MFTHHAWVHVYTDRSILYNNTHVLFEYELFGMTLDDSPPRHRDLIGFTGMMYTFCVALGGRCWLALRLAKPLKGLEVTQVFQISAR